MGDWLLAYGAAIQFDALVVVFGFVALWESFRPRATPRSAIAPRWFSNFALAAASNALTLLCLPIAGLALAVVARDNGWGLLNLVVLPPWLAFVVAVLALDVLQYVLHRIVHTVPLFWRVHKIHHSDVDLDCATTIRHHPLESLLIGALELPLLVALGAPPLAVLASAVLTITASTFTHANVALPARAERVLRHIVVTPDMHRIHHSVRDDECNSNFSMVFPWWDRCFGTLRVLSPDAHARLRFGIAEAPRAADVTLVKSLVMPFRPARVRVDA
jgi:sterol desaturase/sphingolipid hydroxylase (fatty acid hydroxylase superfamily)